MDDDPLAGGGFDPWCERPSDLARPTGVGRQGVTGLSWRQATGPAWERVGRALYVPATRRRSLEQRIVDAGARVSGARAGGTGGVTGWAALRWYGAAYFDGRPPHGDGELPVPLAVGSDRNLRPWPGTLVRRRSLGPGECRLVGGLSVTTVQRALADEIDLRGDLWSAVQAIDMTAAAGLISTWVFARFLSERHVHPGMPLARHAVSLACDESRSPRETWVRLVSQSVVGLDDLLVNQPVYDLTGRLLAVPDLLDEEAGLVIEYDGSAHRSRERRRRDVVREENLRAAGLGYVAVVSGDSVRAAAARIRAARARAAASTGDRVWTTQRPLWDPAPETLDARLERLGLVPGLTSQWPRPASSSPSRRRSGPPRLTG